MQTVSRDSRSNKWGIITWQITNPGWKWPSSTFGSHFSSLLKKMDIHKKPESLKTLELTAEFGTKLVNFLC